MANITGKEKEEHLKRFESFIYSDLLNTVKELESRGINVLNKKSIEKMHKYSSKKCRND